MTSNDGQYLEPEFVLVKEERDEYFGAADDVSVFICLK